MQLGSKTIKKLKTGITGIKKLLVEYKSVPKH